MDLMYNRSKVRTSGEIIMEGNTVDMGGEFKSRIGCLDATSALLEQDIATLRERIGRYQDMLSENNFDGRGLERVSLTTIFRRLKSTRQETIRTRAVLLAAWLKHSEAQNELHEAEGLARRLVDERAQLLAGTEETASALAAAQGRLKELGKMVIAGREALACLDSVEEDLIKLDELGEASGGMLSSAVILDYAHAALAQAGLAQRLMFSFRYAIAGEDGCDTAALTEFADCFLDCLVTDFIPRGRVHDPLACVRGAQNSVALIVAQLDSKVEAQREALYLLRIERGAV